MRRGDAICCPHAASGQMAAAPPMSATNSRRLIAFLRAPDAVIVAGQTGRLEVVRLALGKCPLWVKSGHRSRSASCPLYPRKRTLAPPVGGGLRASTGNEAANLGVAVAVVIGPHNGRAEAVRHSYDRIVGHD